MPHTVRIGVDNACGWLCDKRGGGGEGEGKEGEGTDPEQRFSRLPLQDDRKSENGENSKERRVEGKWVRLGTPDFLIPDS